MTVPPPGYPRPPVSPRPRRWPWAIGGAVAVVAVLVVAFVGWALLSDDTPADDGTAATAAILPPKADVERLTTAAYATVTDDDPRAEPDEFRGAELCRTAWQPLRGAVVGGAPVADRTYGSARATDRQVELGAARFPDAVSARSAVSRINSDVARCSQNFFVREESEANDWRVQQSAGEWYLRPVVAREGNWYCASGVRSEGRYVLRALECGSGPNHVPGLLDTLAGRITAS